jgi:DNA-binding LytR/AlgR family response regulator
LKSVIRAKERYKLRSGVKDQSSVPSTQIDKYIQIKSGLETYRIKIADIQYIEGLGNYVNVYLSDKKIITYTSLKDILEKLRGKQFVRIHKSYIVSVKHIKSFENHQVKLLDKAIPIGKNYKEEFIDLMKNG